MRSLITKATAAVAKFDYLVKANADRPVTLQIDGSLGTDVIAVTGAGVDTADETVLYDSQGSTLEFSATNPTITFYAPIRLAITKPETTNAVGLMELR